MIYPQIEPAILEGRSAKSVGELDVLGFRFITHGVGEVKQFPPFCKQYTFL